jgi:enamine deaminase RidA (YjgF/YER057c/UK114 family)
VTTSTDRLAELGLELPSAAQPQFSYVPVTRYADLLVVSGQLPKVDGRVETTGLVGADVTLEQARQAAQVCTLQGLACVAEFLGSLDAVDGALRVTGFVASAAGFHDQPKVIDAASELLVQVLGDAGRHARSAVGVAALPRNAPVEIEFMFTAKTSGESAHGGRA